MIKATPLENILLIFPVQALSGSLSGIISFCIEKTPLREGENLK